MMHMIGHEGITQQRNFFGFDPPPKEFQIKSAVFIGKEDCLAMIPSLGYVVWVPRDYKTWHSRHSENVSRVADFFQKKSGIYAGTVYPGTVYWLDTALQDPVNMSISGSGCITYNMNL
jgi:hypothetical protein